MSESKKYYVIKTQVGAEQRVIGEIEARLCEHGNMHHLTPHIHSITHTGRMQGYFVIESDDEYHIEKLIGKGFNQTLVKGVKSILGTFTVEELERLITPIDPFEGLEIGNIVTIQEGAFEGERAVITTINENKGEITIELYDEAIPMALHIDPIKVKL